jgi:glycosyltransferase involved in cell wall biosynthesis
VSIVVCTRNRPEHLARCLDALLALDYPEEAREIIVVDNASTDTRTADLVAGRPIRYVREERPGLNWARNRGITSAQFELIAFTDDDARPDRTWLRAIADAFADTSVSAATGLVAPVELDTEAQVQFELGYGGMGHGFAFRAHRWNAETRASEVLWASSFGVGATMAFRREVFDAVGPFDVALDVGTPSNGGGDVEMFHRVVASGRTLVYEPSALVWHTHRREWSSLRGLVFANGQSFGAYLLTCSRNGTVRRSAILWFALSSWFGGWLVPHVVRSTRSGFPLSLALLELTGALTSPFAYCAAQRRARQIRRKGC